ncbi:MAG TPA: hypothetical protein VK454_05295, partial [Myxococcaceae bacterium]|nr:hypothetical protein [Myxococcaceae bacterium]
RVAFFVAVLAALVLVWRRPGPATAERIAGRLVSLMLAVVLIAFVISRQAVAAASVRYLLPPALLALLAIVALAVRRLGPKGPAALVLTGLLVAAFLGGAVLSGPGSSPPAACPGPDRVCPLLAAAREAGLSAGFSTYWNANASTLASGGALRVCPVSLDPPLSPQRWLTSSDCFRPGTFGEGFFVVLGPAERTEAPAGVLRATLGEPDRRRAAGDLELWIYPPSQSRDWSWLER